MTNNLLRISKVNDTPGFPLRASTLYKWLHIEKAPGAVCQARQCCFREHDEAG